MTKPFKATIIINKANGQININPKKKNLSKKFLDDLDSFPKRKIKIKDWEFI